MKPLGVVLQKLGIVAEEERREYVALCPFHRDHTPSWGIAHTGKRKHLHHCFSCGASGDLVGLVMHMRKIGRAAALSWMETLGPLDDPAPLPVAVRFTVQGNPPFRMPAEAVFEPFSRWPTPVRRYAEARHLTREQVNRWGIGYAVDGMLAGRIVLIVRDENGVPASFMARAFGGQKKRYLFPRSSDHPRPDVLFGEEHWPLRKERRRVVVTEGALNALAVERAVGMVGMGTNIAVAALGSSNVLVGHLARLATFPEVAVLTDPDAAGDKAANEIVRGLSRRSRVVRVRLAEGTDADEVSPVMLAVAIDTALP